MVMSGKYRKLFKWLAISTVVALALVAFFAVAAEAQDECAIVLNPAEGKRGDMIEVTGTRFDAGAYLSLYFAADKAEIGDTIDSAVTRHERVVKSVRSSEETDVPPGEFDTYFMVPDIADDGGDIEHVHGGEHDYYVYVTYRYSKEIVASAAFGVYPGEIELTPEIGTVDSRVSINGQGLRPNERINIECDGEEISVVTGDSKTDGNGEFSSTIVIPEVPVGEHTIVVFDEWGDRPEAQFEVRPEISLSPSIQSIDGMVDVRGSGFGVRKETTIALDGVAVPTVPVNLHTTRSGALGGSFVIPPRPAYVNGSVVNVQVRDEDNNVAEAELNVLPIAATIRLSPATTLDSPGYVGMEINVSGIWFTPNTTIDIYYGEGEPALVATTQALDSRNFSGSFQVPPSVPGEHEVTATDEVHSVTAIFTMESERPIAPIPLLPDDMMVMEAGTPFSWEAVSDPSGITYVLQVAADKDFADIVLEENDLASPQYTPSVEERLKLVETETPYYWRVKAVDGTLTESQWSISKAFYVGMAQEGKLPSWMKYFWIALGAGLAVFFVVRLRGRHV
jgi:hypothetical protein